LFAGEALHPPLLCALTFAPHLFFAGLALHPPSALRPQLCTPPLFCGLSFAGIKGFPKLKSLNAYSLAKIGADTAENEQDFAEIGGDVGSGAASAGADGAAAPPGNSVPLNCKISKIWQIWQILQIFGGLVLGCIKTKFCKKICV